jgi:hypothetical protein
LRAANAHAAGCHAGARRRPSRGRELRRQSAEIRKPRDEANGVHQIIGGCVQRDDVGRRQCRLRRHDVEIRPELPAITHWNFNHPGCNRDHGSVRAGGEQFQFRPHPFEVARNPGIEEHGDTAKSGDHVHDANGRVPRDFGSHCLHPRGDREVDGLPDCDHNRRVTQRRNRHAPFIAGLRSPAK